MAAKLNSLGGNKGVDLAALLVSGDSSSSSEEESKKKKKHKKKHAKVKKSKKSKEKKKISPDDSDSSEKKLSNHSKYDMKGKNKSYNSDSEINAEIGSKFKDTKVHKFETRKRKSDDYDSEAEYRNKRKKDDFSGPTKTNRGHHSSDDDGYRVKDRKRSPQDYKRPPSGKRKSPIGYTRMSYDNRRKSPDSQRMTISPDRKRYETETYWNTKKTGLTEQERAARLAEMASAGAEREVQREKRVAQQRAADAKESEEPRRPHTGRNEARALPDSLESRIHSNRHYIQRDKRHMNENFARR